MSRNLKITTNDLDRLVNVEKRTIARGANGSAVETWAVEYASVPAKVLQVGGTDRFLSDQIEGQFDYIITIRFKALIDEKAYRLTYQGRILDITRYPKEIGRRQFLEILCKVRST